MNAIRPDHPPQRTDDSERASSRGGCDFASTTAMDARRWNSKHPMTTRDCGSNGVPLTGVGVLGAITVLLLHRRQTHHLRTMT